MTDASEGPHGAVLIYRDAKDEWRWTMRAANGRIIADSGEGYINQRDCVDAVKLVRTLCGTEGALKIEFRALKIDFKGARG